MIPFVPGLRYIAAREDGLYVVVIEGESVFVGSRAAAERAYLSWCRAVGLLEHLGVLEEPASSHVDRPTSGQNGGTGEGRAVLERTGRPR